MSPIQLETRIQELIEGVLPEEQWPELRDELFRSAAARDLYCGHVRMHALLDRRIKGLKAVLAHTPLIPTMDFEMEQRKRSFHRALMATAAVLIAAAVIMGFVILPPAPPTLSFNAVSGSQFVLTHSTAKDAPKGQELGEGSRMILSQGIVELNFDSGVRSVVRAPADFTLEAQGRLHLKEGIAWFNVPAKAVGFRVVTPELQVIDLGTEFGLISKPNGADEIHVFTGKVEAAALTGVKARETLSAGQARSASVIGNLFEIDPLPERFLTRLPSALPHLHWTFDETDPEHLATTGRDPVTAHITTRLVTPGTSAAFTCVPGKFGRALSSAGLHTYLETDWPGIGGNAPRTMTFWLRVPSGPQYSSGIAGWGNRPGGQAFLAHIRTLSNGCCAGASVGGFWFEGSTPIDDGEWHHHAIVYWGRSLPNGDPELYTYVDGRPEPVTRHLQDNAPRDPHGNILVDTDTTSLHALPLTIFSNLLGRNPDQGNLEPLAIDELHVFEAALSDRQIQNLYRSNQYNPE